MRKIDGIPNSSTLRAFSVLEHIVQSEVPLSLEELTRKSKLPKPTVHRILALLQKGGLLLREPLDKHYGVGERLLSFALNAFIHSPLRNRRHVILSSLVEKIGETCNFTMLDGNEVLYVDRVETSSHVRLHMNIGAHVPLHCTASGKLFLSRLSEAQVSNLIGTGPFERYTERTITDIGKLERELRRIRADGVGIDIGEYLEGSVCLAVPVLDSNRRVCAAVAMHGPIPRMTLKKGLKYLPELRKAALAISATLVPGIRVPESQRSRKVVVGRLT